MPSGTRRDLERLLDDRAGARVECPLLEPGGRRPRVATGGEVEPRRELDRRGARDRVPHGLPAPEDPDPVCVRAGHGGPGVGARGSCLARGVRLELCLRWGYGGRRRCCPVPDARRRSERSGHHQRRRSHRRGDDRHGPRASGASRSWRGCRQLRGGRSQQARTHRDGCARARGRRGPEAAWAREERPSCCRELRVDEGELGADRRSGRALRVSAPAGGRRVERGCHPRVTTRAVG